MFEEGEPDELVEIQRGDLPPEEFDLLLISRRSIHRAGEIYMFETCVELIASNIYSSAPHYLFLCCCYPFQNCSKL
jgi:hypothetical protein